MIGLIATPGLPEFCVSATVKNDKMNFFPVAQLSVLLKSSRDWCVHIFIALVWVEDSN